MADDKKKYKDQQTLAELGDSRPTNVMGKSESSVRFPNGYVSKEPVRTPEQQQQYMAGIEAKLNTIRQQQNKPTPQVPWTWDADQGSGNLGGRQQPPGTQSSQPQTPQPQPQQPLSGLNPNAAKLNGNPDTSGWAGSDIAKANHFSTFGNKWNPSMNTPGLTSFDIAKPQAVQQPPSLKTIQNTQPSQNAQVIRNGQLLNQSFTSDGNGGYNSRMYDAAGNELTRADLEQMDLMARAGRLMDAAMPAWNASSQYANEQAVRALNALSGLKGIPTTSDIQKDSAAIRKMDTETELAPKLAKAEIGLRGAQANMYDTQNQYAAKEYGLKKMGVESTAKYHNALAEQALRGKPENTIEQQRLNLDRQIAAAKEYDMIVGSSPNMPEPQKNKLKRELEVKYGLKQRRSATEFQN